MEENDSSILGVVKRFDITILAGKFSEKKIYYNLVQGSYICYWWNYFTKKNFQCARRLFFNSGYNCHIDFDCKNIWSWESFLNCWMLRLKVEKILMEVINVNSFTQKEMKHQNLMRPQLCRFDFIKKAWSHRCLNEIAKHVNCHDTDKLAIRNKCQWIFWNKK